MNSADTPPPAASHQGSGLQFSIRSLLVLTACSAIVVWLWPMERDDPIEFQILLAFLMAAFLSTLFLTPAAWRRMAEQKRSGIDVREHRFERFAFIGGVLSVVPYGSACLMLYLDPFEHGYFGAHGIMVAIMVIAGYSWIPVQLIVIGSLPLFFGVRRNLPVLLMRIIGLVANLGLVVWFLIGVSRI